MSGKSFKALKEAEARERMAALRRARKSRAAAEQEQREASMFNGAANWRMTNLAEVLSAMSRYAPK